MKSSKDVVSVPLRGKGRDQHGKGGPGKDAGLLLDVSVPLRGKGRDQLLIH